MSTPVWMLAGFTAWTVLLLALPIGFYRWSRILTGRAAVNAFRADRLEGEDWYQRATRAHANCVENLPVFGAIVFALHAGGVGGTDIDHISSGVLLARLVQSCVHLFLRQTSGVVAVRFTFFFVQLIGFFGLLAILALRVGTGV